jgi:hypothetical protein
VGHGDFWNLQCLTRVRSIEELPLLENKMNKGIVNVDRLELYFIFSPYYKSNYFQFILNIRSLFNLSLDWIVSSNFIETPSYKRLILKKNNHEKNQH